MVAVNYSKPGQDELVVKGELDTYIMRTNPRREKCMKRNGLHIYYGLGTPDAYLVATARVLSVKKPEDFREWVLNESKPEELMLIGDYLERRDADRGLAQLYGKNYGTLQHTIIRFRIRNHPGITQLLISDYWTGPKVTDTVLHETPFARSPCPRIMKLDSYSDKMQMR